VTLTRNFIWHIHEAKNGKSFARKASDWKMTFGAGEGRSAVAPSAIVAFSLPRFNLFKFLIESKSAFADLPQPTGIYRICTKGRVNHECAGSASVFFWQPRTFPLRKKALPRPMVVFWRKTHFEASMFRLRCRLFILAEAVTTRTGRT
jgi:hypothetical protein